MKFINISTYRFVRLYTSDLPTLRQKLKERADACDLKGTILLSPEGINCFLSGTHAHILEYQDFLEKIPVFRDLWYKKSLSDHQPFSRMLVRLKKEIIPMERFSMQSKGKKAPYLSPSDFKNYYETGKESIILDTRNDYEVALGSFENAIDLSIETFRDFPNAVTLLPNDIKKKSIVTFCTGGIRCEKAAQHLLNKGFEEVYQLEGGILNYFEKCGGDYWEGECFVFDKRVALNPALEETETIQCYGCRSVLMRFQQSAACPECGSKQHLRKKAQDSHQRHPREC